MIDLDIEMTEKLCRYEIERAGRSGESVNPYCLHHAPAHAMLELITRLRQAEKDAARYRWMLNQHNNVMSKVMVCDGWMLSEPDEVDMIYDLSLFIDEAMQCSK